MAKFQLGIYRFKNTPDDKPEAIEVVKITDKKVSFHIHYYGGKEYQMGHLKSRHFIHNKLITRTIQTTDDGDEYVKCICFNLFEIYKNKCDADSDNSDYDILLIAVEFLRRLEDKEFYYKSLFNKEKSQVHYTPPPIKSSFGVGRFKLDGESDTNDIRITKINNGYISVDVKYYLGSWSRQLENVKFRRKIFLDDYGVEYIKPIYFSWNTILNLTAQEKDSDSGFDILNITSNGLEKLEDVSIEYDEKHYPVETNV